MRRPWYLLGLMLSFLVIFFISLGNAVVTALAYIAYGGYLAMFIKHARGETIEFDDMFSLDNRWISFAFLGIIKMVLVTLGFLFFIIPGLYLSIRWMFAEMLVVDQGMKPVEALRASSKMTEGEWWKLLLFILVVGLLSIIGLAALVVGVLVVSLVAFLAVIKLYDDLKGKVVKAKKTKTRTKTKRTKST